MRIALFQHGKWALIAIAALMLLLALSSEPLALGLAAATAEHRPSLLDDAQWDQPVSALAFRHRFSNGSSEAELLRWLSANHFRIDPAMRHADRVVNGVPCAERIEVAWTAANRRISESRAVVSDAGCL